MKNGYELSRAWFDFCFENPELIKPNHTALYFFIIEHCNRLGWKKKFGLPTEMAKDAIGIKSYNTYINTLNDLVEWGALEMIEKSKNQYSANIVALSNFNKAVDKALDKAMIKHVTKHIPKQRESTGESICSINKPLTNNIKPITINNKQEVVLPFESLNFLRQWELWKEYKKKEHRFKFKTTISEQASLMKLNNLAKQNESTAIKIIHQSISNGWKGFFALKIENNESNNEISTEGINSKIDAIFGETG